MKVRLTAGQMRTVTSLQCCRAQSDYSEKSTNLSLEGVGRYSKWLQILRMGKSMKSFKQETVQIVIVLSYSKKWHCQGEWFNLEFWNCSETIFRGSEAISFTPLVTTVPLGSGLHCNLYSTLLRGWKRSRGTLPSSIARQSSGTWLFALQLMHRA